MPGQARRTSGSASRSPRTATFLVSASLVATAFVVPAAAAAGSIAERAAPQQNAAVKHLEARLRGGANGDANGTGHADFRLNRKRARVCADVTWAQIGTPNAAHIHRKSDTSVVVDLTGSVTGGAKCKNGVSRKLIKRILTYPGRYYFNVHNEDYPGGAIRGTLRR